MSYPQISDGCFTGIATYPVSKAGRRLHAFVAAAACACFSVGASAQAAPGGLIGLPVDADQGQENVVIEPNQAGQVLGFAILGPYGGGRTSWLYGAGTTREIGLAGFGYRNAEFNADNLAQALNEAGQAVGRSIRYEGVDDRGQTAWFYDDDLNQTFALNFSIQYTELPDDGSGSPFPSYSSYAFSQIAYLGEDGLVLGTFSDYANDGRFVGTQLFAWTRLDGKQDLGLLTGDVSSVDWEALAQTHRGLAPVPEPEAWAMLLAGLAITSRSVVRRRRAERQAAVR